MKVKFESISYYHDFIEENKEGELIQIPVKTYSNGTVEAEVLEERKTRYKILLEDGNIILKKKKFVEVV